MTIVVRAVAAGDRDRWQELYAGYGDFYGIPLDDAKADLVWGWLHDPEHESECLVATDDTGRLQGIAHYYVFERQLGGGHGIYLADLFTDESARGQGVASALIGALRELAVERGYQLVRWITASDNVTAQRLYDRVAARTSWVTYDLKVQ